MQPYYYIHANRIIAGVQELLNEIPEIEKADPELLVYDASSLTLASTMP